MDKIAFLDSQLWLLRMSTEAMEKLQVEFKFYTLLTNANCCFHVDKAPVVLMKGCYKHVSVIDRDMSSLENSILMSTIFQGKLLWGVQRGYICKFYSRYRKILTKNLRVPKSQHLDYSLYWMVCHTWSITLWSVKLVSQKNQTKRLSRLQQY